MSGARADHYYSLGNPAFGANTYCKARITPCYTPALPPLHPSFPSLTQPNPALGVQNWPPSQCGVSTQGCPGVVKMSQGGSAHYGKGLPTPSTMVALGQQEEEILGRSPAAASIHAGTAPRVMLQEILLDQAAFGPLLALPS